MTESHTPRRPRPIVSCLRCRYKKLKCDRKAPCENCVKAFTDKTCTYSRDGGHIPSVDGPPSSVASTASSIEDLQRRMVVVEQLLGARQAAYEQLSESDAAVSPNVLETVTVKGGRGVYHGQNDRITLLNQFPEIKQFLEVMSNDEHIQASAKQIKFLQTKSVPRVSLPKAIDDPVISPADLKLREHLPPKPYCDRLLAIYCDHFERTMRVLHIPTFKLQYDHIWADTDFDSNSASIVPQLTAVLIMAYHMDDPDQIGDERSQEQYLQGPAIDLVQAWLDERSRKQRTELSTLQVEMLIILARSLNGMYPEQIWSSTGTLVRSAIIMGLNLDPSCVPNLAPFQLELRRRLWATTLEMDLQASLAAAMPVVLPDLRTSPMPSNLNDLDFGEFSTFLPQSRPLYTFTDNIYQVVLEQSIPLRFKALQLAQSSTTSPQEALQMGDKIEQYISSMPDVVKLPKDPTSNHGVGERLHQVLLDLYLRRPLLSLYKSLLHGQWPPSPELIEMRRRCVSSSMAILSYQDLFSTASLAPITNNPMIHQDFFYRCCKKDVLGAATTCCQHIKLLRAAPTHANSLWQMSQEVASLISTVESTIKSLTARMGRKGSDLKDIVLLALVLHSVQSQPSPSRDPQALQQVLRSTLAACYETLLHPMLPLDQQQTHNPSFEATRLSESNLSAANAPSFPLDLIENAQQWFADLPDLAAEYTDFEAHGGEANGVLSMEVIRDWDWVNMWS